MSIQDEIAYYAKQYGVDPGYALAVASRESSFNPNAHASKTIYGLFQMSAAERAKYGVPYTRDVQTQVAGFAAYTNDLRKELAGRLGRDPSDKEMYLAHYWGAPRAAAVINGRISGMAAGNVFSPRELAENPNLHRGASMGSLANGIFNDMDRRLARYSDSYGGDSTQLATAGDFGKYGTPFDVPADQQQAQQPQPQGGDKQAARQPGVQPAPQATPADAAKSGTPTDENVQPRKLAPPAAPPAEPPQETTGGDSYQTREALNAPDDVAPTGGTPQPVANALEQVAQQQQEEEPPASHMMAPPDPFARTYRARYLASRMQPVAGIASMPGTKGASTGQTPPIPSSQGMTTKSPGQEINLDPTIYGVNTAQLQQQDLSNGQTGQA